MGRRHGGAPRVADAHVRSVPVQMPAAAARHMLCDQGRSAVEQSWEKVQALGAYAVGELLYKHTFQLAPEAMGIFPPEVRQKYRDWSADEGSEDEDLWESAALRKLFGKVINAIGCTVAGLSDMSKLVPMLTKLGMRHINYGVSEAHWPILGQALDLTLRDILGASYTHEVQQAWTTVYGFTSSIMIEGLRQAIKARDSLVHQPSLSNPSDAGCRDDDDAGSQCSSLAPRSEPERAAALNPADPACGDALVKGAT